MNPFEQALVEGGGSGILTAMAGPFATAFTWVVPVIIEMGLTWLAFRYWRKRRRGSMAPMPPPPAAASRDARPAVPGDGRRDAPMLVRRPRGP